MAGNRKHGHPLVVCINLREDPVLECNGDTYSWRDVDDLERPLIVPGVKASAIEVRPAKSLLALAVIKIEHICFAYHFD